MAQCTSRLREIRMRLGLSQAECATALGIAVETFRTWDSGRRSEPEAIVERAKTLEARRPVNEQLPLRVLAEEFCVNVKTLRAAARDGRLSATFSTRPFFGRLTATATRGAVAEFVATWYRRTYGRGQRKLVPVCRASVPSSYSSILVGLRLRLGLSQHQLANKVGAASKAVVYQWESRKRRPSPVFWLRIENLERRTSRSHNSSAIFVRDRSEI